MAFFYDERLIGIIKEALLKSSRIFSVLSGATSTLFEKSFCYCSEGSFTPADTQKAAETISQLIAFSFFCVNGPIFQHFPKGLNGFKGSLDFQQATYFLWRFVVCLQIGKIRAILALIGAFLHKAKLPLGSLDERLNGLCVPRQILQLLLIILQSCQTWHLMTVAELV